MTASDVRVDYYAVLQVHPDAEFEVIEAAYRQLMKKHHPDRAGDDPRRVAEHLERSKAINVAFGVLRDPERRRRYDAECWYRGTRQPPTSSASASASASARPTPPPPPPAAAAAVPTPCVAAPEATLWGPLSTLVAAYYLLPGQYEWEGNGLRELLAVVLIPMFAGIAYALASGRLSAWLGHSLTNTLMAWTALALLMVVSLWGKLLRVGLATVPSLALFSGRLNSVLEPAHMPLWLAWLLVTCLSLVMTARLYVFGVVPALGVCWVLSRMA